jgi:hypothetical protein
MGNFAQMYKSQYEKQQMTEKEDGEEGDASVILILFRFDTHRKHILKYNDNTHVSCHVVRTLSI